MVNKYVIDSHILHRAMAHEPLNIVSGSGVKLILEDGREIIDASSGPAVSCLGHSNQEVTDAIVAQLNKIAYVYSGSRYRNDACEDLAAMLLQDRPGGLSKAIFVNSGSEATDAAIKLAAQYWHEVGQPQRSKVISRKQSYHGNTIGALCVSGHETRRELYSAWMSSNVSFVDPCYPYRGKLLNETDDLYVERLKKQLDDEFVRLGPETVAAFICEPVSGTTLGCVPPVPGYLKAVRDVCDKYGALLVLDEIMCGMGKTGTMHAWQQEEIRGPDIQTIGKALGAGFVPLSAVLLHDKIFQALADGSGGLMHGHTFQAHPTACAGALAVQKIIKRENLMQNVQARGQQLEVELREHIAPLPIVGDVRGRGLFWAVELVKDKKEKHPFKPGELISQRIVDTALDLGLNVLGNLGHTGDHYVDLTILSPPYIVSAQEITTIVQRLKQAILLVGAELGDDLGVASAEKTTAKPLTRSR